MFLCMGCGREFDSPDSRYFEEWDEVFRRCPFCKSEEIKDLDDVDEEDVDDE